jgi:FdhD protein
MKAVKRGVAAIELRHFEAESPPLDRLDRVAVEEPLEIRVSGDVLAVTMRTPGHDHELVAGFALAEGLIDSRSDLGGIAHCGRPDREGFANVVELTPAPGCVIDVERAKLTRRGTLTSAACGVCGRRTISDLLARLRPLDDDARYERSVLAGLTAALASVQPNFALTGGLHAAGVADARGQFLVVREDVGRHNAVDKAVGRLLLDGVSGRGLALVVSGRSSFEIVHKAFVARLPIVVAVSTPSSLAIDTARATGITLIGFARHGAFNVCAGAERVLG